MTKNEEKDNNNEVITRKKIYYRGNRYNKKIKGSIINENWSVKFIAMKNEESSHYNPYLKCHSLFRHIASAKVRSLLFIARSYR